MRVSEPPVTRKELAHKMGIHSRTLYRWLKKENIDLNQRLISPIQQTIILQKFGYQQSFNQEHMGIG